MVTGGSRGIGEQIALAFAGAGATVVVVARQAEAAQATARRVVEAGGQAAALTGDVTDEDSMRELRRAVLDRFARVDAVVANAGTAGPTGPLHELGLPEWRECVATNLEGVFLTFRAFIPALIEQRRGSLIAIASMTGKRPLAGRTPYAAAKMGVIGLCRSLALELGPHGVRVNAVCPGAVSGDRMDGVVRNQARLQGVSEEAAERQFTDASALRRLVSPQEVAEACVFLASEASSAITGEDLNVTAGAVMY